MEATGRPHHLQRHDPGTVQAANRSRFVGYYEAEARNSAVVLATAEAPR